MPSEGASTVQFDCRLAWVFLVKVDALEVVVDDELGRETLLFVNLLLCCPLGLILITFSASVFLFAGKTPFRKMSYVPGSVEKAQPPRERMRFAPLIFLKSSNTSCTLLMSTLKSCVISPNAKCLCHRLGQSQRAVLAFEGLSPVLTM